MVSVLSVGTKFDLYPVMFLEESFAGSNQICYLVVFISIESASSGAGLAKI